MPSDQLNADPSRECWHVSQNFLACREILLPSTGEELYRQVQQSPEGFRLENLLVEMRVGMRVDAADEARIPTSGPVVVVANHPYGVLDGAILTVLLTRIRPDVKVLTNFLLADVPELPKHCIFVDPFHTDRSVESNRRAFGGPSPGCSKAAC